MNSRTRQGCPSNEKRDHRLKTSPGRWPWPLNEGRPKFGAVCTPTVHTIGIHQSFGLSALAGRRESAHSRQPGHLEIAMTQFCITMVFHNVLVLDTDER